ncbi:MAG TPA: hypothetical protein VGH44_02840 [Candidatus Saccharimonadia bacterium]|jgi:hypothetical protein
MSELVNYSIETDKIVLLSFKDGRSLRVPFNHLSNYLRGTDLEKVKKTINLRRHFLRIHMPRFFIILAAIGGAVALLSVGSKTVASLLGHQPAPQHTVNHTGIARSQLVPSPGLSPAAAQPAQRDMRLTAIKRVAQPKASSVQTTTTPVPAPPASTPMPLASPMPMPMPTPSPAVTPSPTPSPSPTPTIQPAPAKSQVLGDSTAAPATTN